MSSALSSAKNRRTNPQPVIPPGKNNEFQQQGSRQLPPSSNPPPVANNQVSGLSLQQVIEIYGRRLNQLEAFMTKSQSQQQVENVPPVRDALGNSGASLAQIQELIHAKIRDYNDQLYTELQPLRDGLQQQAEKQTVVSEADFSEFHSRCQMLAEEIFQLKDTVLKLQEFTMSVNKQLLEKSGVLTANNESQTELQGLHIPENDVLEDIEEEQDM